MSANAERLAWGTANHDTGRGESRLGSKKDLFAFAMEISLIGCATIGVHFEAMGREPLCLKSERKAAATRKEI